MHKIIAIFVILFSFLFLANRLEIFKKKFNVNVFFFFTNLSVLFSMIFSCFTLFYKGNSPLYFLAEHYIVFYLFIVMLIYNFVLAPKARQTNANHDFYSIYDCMAHIFIPLLMLADWCFFIKHQNIPVITIPLCLLYPILYCILVLIKGQKKFGKPYKHSKNYYPYFFLEVDTYGWKKVIFTIFILLGLFVLLAAVFLFFNTLY